MRSYVWALVQFDCCPYDKIWMYIENPGMYVHRAGGYHMLGDQGTEGVEGDTTVMLPFMGMGVVRVSLPE